MRFVGLDPWPEAVPLQAPDFEPRVVGDLVLEFRAEAVEIG